MEVIAKTIVGRHGLSVKCICLSGKRLVVKLVCVKQVKAVADTKIDQYDYSHDTQCPATEIDVVFSIFINLRDFLLVPSASS